MNAFSQYSEELKCSWISWRPIGHGHLALDMPEDNCCDMRAAVIMAAALMPRISRITTFSGGVADTQYQLRNGEWVAFESRPPVRVRGHMHTAEEFADHYVMYALETNVVSKIVDSRWHFDVSLLQQTDGSLDDEYFKQEMLEAADYLTRRGILERSHTQPNLFRSTAVIPGLCAIHKHNPEINK